MDLEKVEVLSVVAKERLCPTKKHKTNHLHFWFAIPN